MKENCPAWKIGKHCIVIIKHIRTYGTKAWDGGDDDEAAVLQRDCARVNICINLKRKEKCAEEEGDPFFFFSI